MKLLRLTCGVSASIKLKQDLAKKYQSIALSVKGCSKKRILVKPDEYCLS